MSNITRSLVLPLALLAAAIFAGCQAPATSSSASAAPAAAAPSASVPAAPAPAAPAAKPAPAAAAIRVKTGVTAPFTDSSGNVWQADTGFADGETIARSDLAIKGTKDQGIYQAERYSMTAFTWKLPNGKYTVKLHFAETYEGITGAGQRVFSYKVGTREFKDFDVFAKSGGFATAYIETVETTVTDGKLDITFTPNVENPEINGIEIIPHA
jgi:hypothetical protein